MDALFQYRIPVLHPIVVHLPPSFLVAAVIAAVAWLARGDPFWRKTCFFLMVLASASCFPAYFSGEEMEEQSEGVAVVEELVELHEELGLYTLIGACVTTAALAVASFLGHTGDRLPVRIAITCLVLISAVLVAWTAHIGGIMVWGVAS